MHYEHMSNRTLLRHLIGETATRTWYEGSLTPLFERDRDDGQDELVPLFAARELLRRWLAERIRRSTVFATPEVVKDFLALNFAGQTHESFVAIYLDAQHGLIEVEELFRGTLTQTAVYPREVVKHALYRNAAAIVFAHNHPSGCAEPSRADEFLTQSLKTALALIDVRVVDHFVVAGNTAVSFAERGLL